MRTTQYTFTVEEHEEYGVLGFTPTWYPAGEPLGGVAVAHDILEHFPGDDGSPEGEYQALGACLYIRGDEYFHRLGKTSSAAENIAADLPLIWETLRHRDNRTYVRVCPPVKSLALEEAEEAIRHFKAELFCYDDEDYEKPTDADYTAMIQWIAKGYNKAKRRYPNVLPVRERLFIPIEEEAGTLLKHAEPGQILTVSIDWNNLEVSLSCEYPYEEEEE
jgi:hypothetical protein